MKELVYSVKVVTRDELVGPITPYTALEWRMKLQLLARSSQPSGSGSLFCGRGGILENEI
jgi:hypothetical protein